MQFRHLGVEDLNGFFVADKDMALGQAEEAEDLLGCRFLAVPFFGVERQFVDSSFDHGAA